MRQGDIWWADLPPPSHRRPVLILTRSSIISNLKKVTVAPLTRTIRGIDSEVVLSPEVHGVPSRCAVSLDNIFTTPQTGLDMCVTRISSDAMSEVFEAIRFVFAMP
jgi:mRNA interferase MazF